MERHFAGGGTLPQGQRAREDVEYLNLREAPRNRGQELQLGLAAVLYALGLVVFFPYVGWSFFGLAVGPMLILKY